MSSNSMKHPDGQLILCVEDEPDLLRDIAEEFDEAGYRTRQACDAKQALTQLRHIRPDLILCDIAMPGMDGFGLLDAVRSKGQDYADVPFVFLTALSDPQDIIEGKRLGADDYLIKPVDYDLMLATVEARLREVERMCSARNNRAGPMDAATLASRYELTPTEIQVAEALTQGKQPADIAADFGVSRTTVAFHLRNLFDKTGTGRQAELVALLLRPD